MKSHIIVPRSFIKYWGVYRDNKIYVDFYELKSGVFDVKEESELLTHPNYYSQEIENFLSSSVEKPLGDLRNKLIDFFEKKEEMSISKKMIKNIRIAFTIMLIRNEKIVENVNNLFFEDYGFREDSSLNDVIHAIGKIGKFYLTSGLTFMPVRNISNHFFIIPSNWVIGFLSVKDEDTMFLPLTPEIGVIFTNDKEFVTQARNAKVMYIQDDILADWFNNSLISSELVSSKNGYIFGREEDIKSVIDKRFQAKNIQG